MTANDNLSRQPASWARRLWAPALLVLAFAAVFALGLDDYLSFRALSDHRDQLKTFVDNHFVAGLLIYAGLYAVAVALSLPGGLLLTVSGGFLFGWFAAGSVTVLAATVGATAIFLIARTSLGEPLRARAGNTLKRLEAGFREDAMHYLLFLRLVPLFPFWLVNIAPAFLGVRLRTFFLATLFGILPGTFVFAFLGTGLDSVIREQQAAHQACLDTHAADGASAAATACPFDFDLGALVTWEILVALAGLGVIALLPVIFKKLRAQRA
ncbi:TVP38/TMEM64 family protein [Oceanibacterium hippocampi]|uniref:TVP38/TMEM64 family membrane protein n=1 Tax=Oceanibacterium hippocampi TaxID=745714 RepID=A0A1Y5RTX2_9PROT|nr:TVP38/TMEM64 family protein [Oceanibacterium hippocampi]SLN25367.1 TVP38/TMEM64 family inner membrane protein YdjZ [Oceanibacterium hippocampi]